MWRQRQGGLSLTRSPSLHELALNCGLTQLQQHQTLQCLRADSQAVLELWIKVLKEMVFCFLSICKQLFSDCSGCKYIMWGWGVPQNIDRCVLPAAPGYHCRFTTSVSLKQQVPSLIARRFGWLQLCLLPSALKWCLLVLVHGGVRLWVFTTSPAILTQQILDRDVNIWSDKNLPRRQH